MIRLLPIITKIKWVLLWAILIFILCCLPGKSIPYRSIWDEFGLDKLIHASLFCILIVLAAAVIYKESGDGNKMRLIIAVVFAIVYGGMLEIFQQQFIEGRSADVFDFVANSAGAIVGAYFNEPIRFKFKTLFKIE